MTGRRRRLLKIASKCGFKLARAWVDQEGRMILGFANAPEIEPEIEKREATFGTTRSPMKIAKRYPYLYRDNIAKARSAGVSDARQEDITVKGAFGSPEFAANYRAALEGERLVPAKPPDALARTYLRPAAFAELSPATQRARRHLVEQFIGKYGKLPVAGLERRHVAIMDDLASTPHGAQHPFDAPHITGVSPSRRGRH